MVGTPDSSAIQDHGTTSKPPHLDESGCCDSSSGVAAYGGHLAQSCASCKELDQVCKHFNGTYEVSILRQTKSINAAADSIPQPAGDPSAFIMHSQNMAQYGPNAVPELPDVFTVLHGTTAIPSIVETGHMTEAEKLRLAFAAHRIHVASQTEASRHESPGSLMSATHLDTAAEITKAEQDGESTNGPEAMGSKPTRSTEPKKTITRKRSKSSFELSAVQEAS